MISGEMSDLMASGIALENVDWVGGFENWPYMMGVRVTDDGCDRDLQYVILSHAPRQNSTIHAYKTCLDVSDVEFYT